MAGKEDCPKPEQVKKGVSRDRVLGEPVHLHLGVSRLAAKGSEWGRCNDIIGFILISQYLSLIHI